MHEFHAVAFRPKKTSIITKDSGLRIGWKKKGLYRTPITRMIAYVGAGALNCRGNLLDT